MVCYMVIWYIFPVLVYGTKTNLATLGEVEEGKNPRKSRQHLVLTDGCKRQEGLSRASSLQLDFPRSQSIILPTNYQ
jgi:hypothetical protein